MISKRALKLAGLIGIAMALATFAPARAAGDDDDPPSRVARLAYAHGSVSFQPAGTDDWVNSVVNRPMTTGDKLWSDNDSRAEMQLDGSLIRLSNDTGVAFLNLSDNVTQIQLSVGTLLIRVRRLDDDETYEVDTPNLALSILRPGLYRLSVNEAGDTTIITVRTGEGEVTGGGAAYRVRHSESESFTGTEQLAMNPLDDERAAKTNSTLGAQIEMLTGNTPDLPGTSRQTWSVTKTLMTTACGAQRPITETCGFRTRRGRTGLLTTTGIGLTSSRGVIPGWMMSRGVLLRFTMAAGFVWMARGAGCQHRRGQKEWSTFGPYTPRRW